MLAYMPAREDLSSATALAEGRAFADLSFWRKIGVSGADALEWLNDLVSADLSDLAPGLARQALLLSPTGRVRAEFTVTVPDGNLILLQDPIQPRSIGDLLSPYVLSSHVELEDRTDDVALFAFPGRTTAPDLAGTTYSSPSCLGIGVDLISMTEDHDRILGSLARAFTPIGNEEVEAWRIAAGIPKVGVDALEDDLPQECGLESALSFDKGCFLGQEAVAKVRNLGHPRRLLLSLQSADAVAAGEPILDGDRDVGQVTSAARLAERTVLLARVRWDARDVPLRTALGAALTPRRADPAA
jgi:folate-binding protein YgfZ